MARRTGSRHFQVTIVHGRSFRHLILSPIPHKIFVLLKRTNDSWQKEFQSICFRKGTHFDNRQLFRHEIRNREWWNIQRFHRTGPQVSIRFPSSRTRFIELWFSRKGTDSPEKSIRKSSTAMSMRFLHPLPFHQRFHCLRQGNRNPRQRGLKEEDGRLRLLGPGTLSVQISETDSAKSSLFEKRPHVRGRVPIRSSFPRPSCRFRTCR